MDLIGLFVVLVVIGLMFWAVRALMAAFKIPEPISTVVYVLLVIVVVLYLLQAFGLWSGGPVLRVR